MLASIKQVKVPTKMLVHPVALMQVRVNTTAKPACKKETCDMTSSR
jgi:hypothetical protein